MSRRDIAGRVVLVTGATSGVGRATAERLLARGAVVVGCARTRRRVDEVRERVPALDLRALDVRDPTARVGLVDAVVGEYGRIDVLVNNAGVGRYGRLADLSQRDVDETYATNTVAATDLTRLVLPSMLRRGTGDVVMVSSSATWSSFPPLTLYTASKSAIEALVEGLRRELRHTGVLVHSLQPGPLRTELLSRSGDYEPSEDDDFTQSLPLLPGPESAARQVERCLRGTRPRTVAVPPWAAVGRVAATRPARLVLDVVFGRADGWAARQAERLIAGQRPPADVQTPTPGTTRP
jgi:NAD(P)-dependent dehydrogenase (short-subunit alcohol dehydrogenase family)